MNRRLRYALGVLVGAVVTGGITLVTPNPVRELIEQLRQRLRTVSQRLLGVVGVVVFVH